MKKIFWPLLITIGVCAFLFVPAYRNIPPGHSYVLLLGIPLFLWMFGLILQNDRLCSTATRYLYLLATVLCLTAGLLLNHYNFFPEKGGGMVVLFGVPLVFAAVFEICRLIYVAIRGETPCFNYRSGRWLGDPPRNGFFTTYPDSKVISWADALFGITVGMVSMAATLTLIIWSLAANW
jgi:hypothetical protein